MKASYIEKIYAGWLAKIIGIRLGAPIEGWTYEKIKNVYGELKSYPVEYHTFAADDDSNGPFFFLRALEDSKRGKEMTAQDVADALLNYAPFEHGFFWWGGYGVSTEHTAYLNLHNGIDAPRSGSIEQNGSTVAEQIGGQIFSDTWGLVSPGNTDLAVQLAAKASSVTHGGNGIYGGMFIAACISYAFVEHNVKKIIEKGLSYIPEDCEYTKVVKAVLAFYEKHPENWRKCFEYIYENYGYDKYPGNCHIIPNAAVIILALLYGEGDFDSTLTICNMCGWDTDCNVGNVATIMGVRNGLGGIDYDKWRKPINDLLICSSVIGSLNLMDIPYGAMYITKLAYMLAGEELPEYWKEIIEHKIDSCHFEYPGSTHAMRVRREESKGKSNQQLEYALVNTDEAASSGMRSLKMMAKPIFPGERLYAYKKTYYTPQDFDDSRYDPCFSPIVYTGQRIYASVCLISDEPAVDACLYVKDRRTNEIYYSQKIHLKKEEWSQLQFDIPTLEGALIEEVGVCFDIYGVHGQVYDFGARIDDLYIQGNAKYTIAFDKEEEEVWNGMHKEISQFTRLKGLMYLEDGMLHLSSSDFAEAYTGHYDWENYKASFFVIPIVGENHMVNVRVQGAMRSYAIGLLPNKQVAILKNDRGYKVVVSKTFDWQVGEEYEIQVTVQDNQITTTINQDLELTYQDADNPYLTGSIGVSVYKGSHCKYRKISVS